MSQKKGQVLIEKNKDPVGRVSVKNMQAKPINQGRGPTTGNQNPGSKRADFVKSKETGEKPALAKFVLDALGDRGVDMKPYKMAGTEPLDADRGPKRNPTAGGTHYEMRSKKK
jgi:hypothetical protein